MKLSINNKLVGAELLQLPDKNCFKLFVDTDKGLYTQLLVIYPELLNDEKVLLKSLNSVIKSIQKP